MWHSSSLEVHRQEKKVSWFVNSFSQSMKKSPYLMLLRQTNKTMEIQNATVHHAFRKDSVWPLGRFPNTRRELKQQHVAEYFLTNCEVFWNMVKHVVSVWYTSLMETKTKKKMEK